MIELGKKQTLQVVKTVDFGVYLAEDMNADTKHQVLLPAKQVPAGTKAGDKLEVFIYKDSQDRMIATTNEPRLTVGEAGLLRVKQVTKIGLLATGTAWGEWGVDEMSTLVSGGAQLGYTPAGMESGFELSTLFPDYSMAGMPEWTGYILSAVVGVALLVIFFKIISSLMKDKINFKKKAA